MSVFDKRPCRKKGTDKLNHTNKLKSRTCRAWTWTMLELTSQRGWRHSGNLRSRFGTWWGHFLCQWPGGSLKKKKINQELEGHTVYNESWGLRDMIAKQQGRWSLEWKWAGYMLERDKQRKEGIQRAQTSAKAKVKQYTRLQWKNINVSNNISDFS